MSDRLGLLARGLVVAGALGAAVLGGCAGSGRASADDGPDGTWTLTGTLEDDGSTEAADSGVSFTFTIDSSARRIVSRSFWKGASTPFETTTFDFIVTERGTWRIDDAGPDGRRIEFAVACTGSDLTLTRVWHEGPDCLVAVAASVPGGSPPPVPGTVPPPRKYFFSR